MADLAQLNVRVPADLKESLKGEASVAGMKLEDYVAGILARRKAAEVEAGASKSRGSVKPPPPEPPASPFDKKQARAAWDKQFKKLPPEMRDAWKEEHPRP